MSRAKSVDVAAEQRLNQALGQRLQTMRLAQGRILSDLAACVGVSYQAYQKYELGENAVSYPRLVSLAEALGVTPAALVDAGSPPDAQAGLDHRHAREVNQTFATLSPRDQALVLHILRDLGSRTS